MYFFFFKLCLAPGRSRVVVTDCNAAGPSKVVATDHNRDHLINVIEDGKMIFININTI